MKLTLEQQAILDLATSTNESFVIDAKAGSGKTATLLELMATGSLRGTSVYLAFNRAIADEMKSKVGNRLTFEQSLDVGVSTVHSHGLSAFRRAGAKPRTLEGKCMFILKDAVESEYDKDDDIWRNLGKIKNLVSYAKAAGFGLTSINEPFPEIADENAWRLMIEHFNMESDLVGETTSEEMIRLAKLVLNMSNKRTNSIDFDDMIYLPLLLNLPIPQYNNVLIDEAQDINATRRELAFRSVKPGGRLIAVGDPNQAIYGFTGADAASMLNIEKRLGHEAKVMPLSICWRCDGAIIKEAQKIVPEIRCRPGAEELGQVIRIPFIAPPPKITKIEGEVEVGAQVTATVETPADFFSLVQPGDAVLCRLNKPNVAVCLALLRRGVRAKIEGRDLGKRLEYHVNRSCDNYAFQPLADTLSDLELYKEQELDKMAAKNKSEAVMGLFEDEVDAAHLIIERCLELNRNASYESFSKLVADLFGDNISSKELVLLCSVHKSKGREWPRVFILGRYDYMPFHLAKMEWEEEQEHNLIYVANTRAERTLFLVTDVMSAIDKGLHREVKPTSVQPNVSNLDDPTGEIANGPAPAFLHQSLSQREALRQNAAAKILTPADLLALHKRPRQ